MFQGCTNFDQPLESRTVSASTNLKKQMIVRSSINPRWLSVNTGIEFSAMFSGCNNVQCAPRQLEYDRCHRVQRNVKKLPSISQSRSDVVGEQLQQNILWRHGCSQLLTNWQVTDTLSVGGVDAMFYTVVAPMHTRVRIEHILALAVNNYTMELVYLQQLVPGSHPTGLR